MIEFGWRLPVFFASFAASLALAIVPAEANAEEGVAGLDVEAYRSVLVATVRDQKVDYLRLRRDHLGALERFLDGYAKVEFARLRDDEALAAGIDLYNATVLLAVAQRIRLGYRVDEREFALFKEPRIQLGPGDKISLDHLEHQILRPRFPGGLLHVGLVCGAISCPPLEATPYLGSESTKTLERRMGEFLRDAARNRVDRAAKSLELSRLFDWFAVDFGGKDAVTKYTAKYLGSEVEVYVVTFRDYDWALNFAPPASESAAAGFVVFASDFAERSGQPADVILDLVTPWDPNAPSSARIEVILSDGQHAHYPRSGLEVFHKL